MLTLKAPRVLIAAAAALTLMVTGCIVVVEEDDFGRGRHHGLHGTSWTLQFIFAHGHHYRVQEGPYAISFNSEVLSGTAGCASFTADYDAGDDSIRINRFRSSTIGCTADEVQSLFLEYLPAVTELTVDESSLQLEAGDGAHLVFGK